MFSARKYFLQKGSISISFLNADLKSKKKNRKIIPSLFFPPMYLQNKVKTHISKTNPASARIVEF